MIAYSELPASPKPFNYAELVESHGGEEDFGAVGICQLPCQESPVLPIVQQVRTDFDPEEVLGVCQAGDDRRADHTQQEKLSNGCVGETGGEHVGVDDLLSPGQINIC